MTAQNKPIELELFEAKRELAEAINSVSARHKLSAYFLNEMLDGIHGEVRRVAEAQLAQMARQAAEQTEAEKSAQVAQETVSEAPAVEG